MIKEFIITYWQLIAIGFLLLNTGIQKLEKIKGDSDILTWIWQFLTWVKSVTGQVISVVFSAKPGKLPMLFIGLFITSLFFTGLTYAGSNVTLQWEGNMAYENVTHYNVYRSCDQETWVLANVMTATAQNLFIDAVIVHVPDDLSEVATFTGISIATDDTSAIELLSATAGAKAKLTGNFFHVYRGPSVTVATKKIQLTIGGATAGTGMVADVTVMWRLLVAGGYYLNA